MDQRDEVRRFLISRRARITPEQAGLPSGGARRVPGLRRAEAAVLANVSVEYYARLERGNLAGVSGAVLESVAKALALDESERQYLFDLAAAANRAPAARPRARAANLWTARPGLQQLIDAIDGPAYVRNSRLDILAANRLGRAFYDDAFADPETRPNFARFIFLDPERSRSFYPDWELAAAISAAILRVEVGRGVRDPGVGGLVDELTEHSADFRRHWAAGEVRIHGAGTKRFRHGVVGDLELQYEELELNAEPGLTLTVFTAVKDSVWSERLRLLASWAATADLPGTVTRE